MRRSATCRQLDFALAGLRYELMRAPGAAAAAALVTGLTHFAARRFCDHVSVIGDLLPVAADDTVGLAPPPILLTRSYTIADAQECATSKSSVGRSAACLSDRVMQGIVRILRESGASELLMLRRLLGAALRSLPAESLLDCARGLGRQEALAANQIILLVPVPVVAKHERDVWDEIDLKWDGVSRLPWTRESYASVVASALMTACVRLEVAPGAIAGTISRPRSAPRLAAQWHRMPSGAADTVPGMVGLVRSLSALIIDHAMTCRGERRAFLGAVAGYLCPVSLRAFADRFCEMAVLWNMDLPARLEHGKLVLVVGDAPAVVV